MATLNGNIFRQAKQLLDKKDAGAELTEEEQELVSTVTAFVANETPKAFPDDEMLVSSGLEELAKIVEEAKQNGVIPRRDQVQAVPHVR
ncbi:hypothetical protein ES703_40258 [subsurface metagenome]